VTGTSYGIIAPLLHGVTSIVDEADFDAERWYAHPAGPERQRLVHRADRHPHADEGRAERRAEVPFSEPALRRQRGRAAQSGGRVVGREVLGLPIHDNWWQTETGGIMIANTSGASTSSPARWGAAAGHRGRHRAARRRAAGRSSTRARRRGRTGAESAAGRRCCAAT
jgi:acyl-coenzyme A synthetase/AMP-(fatty) acid ligase